MDDKLFQEDIAHLKNEPLIINLATDGDQTFVFQNQEWQISDKNINKNYKITLGH